MKTDELIDLLASGDVTVDRAAMARRFAIALALGTLGSLCILLAVFGLRHDLDAIAHTPLFWAKCAFPLTVLLGAWWALNLLGKPGRHLGARWLWLTLPFAAVWLAGATVYLQSDTADHAALLLGQSWRSCPFNILLLSVPIFCATFWAARSMAPTRLSEAGAAAGLLSSSLATLVYCLHCPEMSPAFWGIWYAIGIMLPCLIGLALGPRLLRW
jgi:hypothetical protein